MTLFDSIKRIATAVLVIAVLGTLVLSLLAQGWTVVVR